MKKTITKKIGVWVAIIGGIVAIVWKVTPTFLRVAQVPDKLDALILRVDSVADANAEMRGEVKSIKQMLQGRSLVLQPKETRDYD
jgi:hypothetical protein